MASSDSIPSAPTPPTAANPSDEAIYCPHCDYDLRMLDTARCPECGKAVNLAQLRQSQIPWLQRQTLGRWEAFFRTARLVAFHRNRLRNEMGRPVDYREARRFQRQLVAWFTGWMVFGVAAWFAVLWWRDALRFEEARNPAIITALAVPFLALSLLLITGMHSYWFHPRRLSVEKQNRAVALSYYAAAPLAYIPLLALATVVGVVASVHLEQIAQPLWLVGLFVALSTLSAVCIPVVVMIFWRCCAVLAQRAAERSKGTIIFMAVALPILWLLLPLIVLGLPALLALQIWVMLRVW